MWRKCDPQSCECHSQKAEIRWGVVGEKDRVRVAKELDEAGQSVFDVRVVRCRLRTQEESLAFWHEQGPFRLSDLPILKNPFLAPAKVEAAFLDWFAVNLGDLDDVLLFDFSQG
jgi:hypothetical protein